MLSLILCMSSLLPVAAQSDGKASRPQPDLRTHPEWPKARQGDADSIEHIVGAFFQAISAPKGGRLNRERLLSLFAPAGRIIATQDATATHPADIVVMSPEAYADMSDSHTAGTGFFDRNPANQIESFGAMAHVYAFYESRNDPKDDQPIARGMKSFELINSAGRWYIVQVFWDYESAHSLVPRKYRKDFRR